MNVEKTIAMLEGGDYLSSCYDEFGLVCRVGSGGIRMRTFADAQGLPVVPPKYAAMRVARRAAGISECRDQAVRDAMRRAQATGDMSDESVREAVAYVYDQMDKYEKVVVPSREDLFTCCAGVSSSWRDVTAMSIEGWFSPEVMAEAGLVAFCSAGEVLAAHFAKPGLFSIAGLGVVKVRHALVMTKDDELAMPLADVKMTDTAAGFPLVTKDFYEHVLLSASGSSGFTLQSNSACACSVTGVDTSEVWCDSAYVGMVGKVVHATAHSHARVVSLTDYANAVFSVLGFAGLREMGYCYLGLMPTAVSLRAARDLGPWPEVDAVIQVIDGLRVSETWRPETAVLAVVDGRYHVQVDGTIPGDLDPWMRIGGDVGPVMQTVKAADVGDRRDSVFEKLDQALAQCGLVGVSGGSSPGDACARREVRDAGLVSTAVDDDDASDGVALDLATNDEAAGEYAPQCYGTKRDPTGELARRNVKFDPTVKLGASNPQWYSRRDAEADVRRGLELAARLKTGGVVDHKYVKSWARHYVARSPRPGMPEIASVVVSNADFKGGRDETAVALKDTGPVVARVQGWHARVHMLARGQNYSMMSTSPGTRFDFSGSGPLHVGKWKFPAQGTVLVPLSGTTMDVTARDGAALVVWTSTVGSGRVVDEVSRQLLAVGSLPVLQVYGSRAEPIPITPRVKFNADGTVTYWRRLFNPKDKIHVTFGHGSAIPAYYRVHVHGDDRFGMEGVTFPKSVRAFVAPFNADFTLRGDGELSVKVAVIDDIDIFADVYGPAL